MPAMVATASFLWLPLSAFSSPHPIPSSHTHACAPVLNAHKLALSNVLCRECLPGFLIPEPKQPHSSACMIAIVDLSNDGLPSHLGGIVLACPM
jgi:hypothetical protein